MRMRVAVFGTVVIALVLLGWAASGSRQQQGDRAPVSQVQASQTQQASQVALLKVEGMFCAGCEAAVKMAANKVDGVRDTKVSSEKGTAEIVYDPSKTTPDAIAVAISKNTGFKTEAVEQHRKL